MADKTRTDVAFTALPAISLHQPWASLWLIPAAKVHETRHWRAPAKYIGQRIVVHAAKTRQSLADLDDEVREICARFLGPAWLDRIPFGAFIGSITLAECREMGTLLDSPVPAHADDAACGYWAPGRYAWRGDSPAPFEPIPAMGHQGFWMAGISRADPAPAASPARKPLGLYMPKDDAP